MTIKVVGAAGVKAIVCSAFVSFFSACPAPVVEDPAQAKDLTALAKKNYPRVLDLHQKIVSRSCAPNAGVCHNTNNYPELSSPSAFVQTIDAWCNLASPDPTQGFDLCERAGDVLVSGSYRSEIAVTQKQADGTWHITVREPPTEDDSFAAVRFESADGAEVFEPFNEWGVTIARVADDPVIVLSIGIEEPFFTEPFIDEALSALVQGDANANGIFGAETVPDSSSTATVIAPKSLERSYLWGRITGTVPGTRMPLANQALTDEEYVAVACFIEGLEPGVLPDENQEIDYDACAFAKKPTLFAISE